MNSQELPNFKIIDPLKPADPTAASLSAAAGVPLKTSSKSKRFKINRKKILIWSSVLIILLTILTVFLFLPGYRVYQDTQTLLTEAKQLKTEFSKQDLPKMSAQITAMKSDLSKTEGDYLKLHYLSIIPVASGYYKDGETLLSMARHGLIAGELLVSGITPFADVFGFSTGSKDAIPADQKIQEIAQNLPQMLPSYDAALQELDQIQSEMQDINPKRYPKKIKGIELQSKLIEAQSTITNAKQVASDIRPVLEKLPQALGTPDPINYLILFQNDKELRPTGGFLTAYAVVTFDQGRFKIIKSEDIYNIDKEYSYATTPSYIPKYLAIPALYMRDSNIYPDYKASMELFSTYWDHMGPYPYSGIIAIDTEFVRTFMEILGPIHLSKYNETFEAKNIVMTLEDYSEKILKGPYRKDLLGDLMSVMVERTLAAKQSQWKPLFAEAFTQMNQKHLLLYFKDPTLQATAEKYNFAGRVVDFNGDYLEVVDMNLGGLKSDYWVERDVNQKINIADDGTVTKEVEITFRNQGAFDGWYNATTRTYTRIYVPQGSTLISTEGGQAGSEETYEELGKTVFAVFSRTAPLNSKTIKFTYELPFKITSKGLSGKKEYKLLVQKQPGVGKPQPDLKYPHYTIEVNGQSKADYDLLTDMAFDWQL